MDLCIPHLLAAQADRSSEAVAIAAPGRVPLTYRRLHQHMCEVVSTLQASGIGRHERVAIVLPNGPEMAVAFVAVAAGAISAPLNPAYRAHEVDFYLTDLRPKALMVQAREDSPARTIAEARGIPILELSPLREQAAGLFTLTEGRRARPARASYAQPDDVALVLHTSGTTSRPKIVPLTHTNLCASAHHVGLALELGNADRCLNVMPLFHIHGLVGALLASLAAGASIVCTSGFDASHFFAWLETFRPTWYTAVPTMHQALLTWPTRQDNMMGRSSLRFIRSSSAPLPTPVMRTLERVFHAPVIESYGMTEASHQIASNGLPPRRRKPGSVGKAAGPEVAIMDEAGHLLPAHVTGEIVIRGANVTLGYEGDSIVTTSAFTDGWFRTGDQGHLDAEGDLFITGRLKEIINRGGEKIAPSEVDDVLLTHPGVAEAITFAVPHATLGEDVAAAVVLRDDVAVTDSEIRSFTAGQLADFKVPRQVLILKDIPKGPTGKPQRLGLAEKLGLTALNGPFNGEADSTAPRTPVEEMLARIWTRLLGLQQVGVHDDFFQCGGNSLLAVHLFVQIEKIYGRRLPVATILQAQTIAEQASMLDQEHGSTTWPALVAIQPSGSRPPFFCIHAHDGHVLYFRHLAFHLGRDQPLYGLQADGRQPQHASIQEMAAHYLDEVRQLQPESPYFLGGFCFGGFVAFEMAQQLQAQGQDVALLALISTHAPGCHEPSPPATSFPQARRFIQKLHELLIDLALFEPQERLAHLREEAKQLHRNRIEPAIRRLADHLSVGSRDAVPRHLGEIPVSDVRPLRDYVPTPYSGRVTLFRPRQQAADAVHDPQFGWGRLAARGVEVHLIPGYRLIMHEPRVRPLAELLRSCLQRAMASTTRM